MCRHASAVQGIYRQSGKYRRGLAFLCQSDWKPAYLFISVLCNQAAQDIGYQLRSQADAQNDLSAVYRLFNEFLLLCQPGVSLLLIDVHGTAHDDQPVKAGWRRKPFS